jgi:hypothetical protein
MEQRFVATDLQQVVTEMFSLGSELQLSWDSQWKLTFVYK